MASLYGINAYGTGQYSRFPSVELVGDIPVTVNFNVPQLDASYLFVGDIPLNIGAALTATFSNPVDAFGTIDVGTVLLAGDPYRLMSIDGGISYQITIDGTPYFAGVRDLIGDIDVTVTLGPSRLVAIFELDGDLEVGILIGGQDEVAPVWQTDTGCLVTPWVPSEACHG